MNGAHVTCGDVTRPTRLGAGGARGEDVIGLGAGSAGCLLAPTPVRPSGLRLACPWGSGLRRSPGPEARWREHCQPRADLKDPSGGVPAASPPPSLHPSPRSPPPPPRSIGKGLPALLHTRVPLSLIASSPPGTDRLPGRSDLLDQCHNAGGRGTEKNLK